jgi:HPt (histidine-containing phosphotransfer) domain-containing protein
MSYINLEYLRLMADGDADLEKTMLDMLLEELPAEFTKMKSLFAAENWEELSKVSHKMKSTLAFIGNESMTNANKAIEKLSKNQPDAGQIGALLAIMEADFEAVLQALEQAAASYS